MSTSPPLVVADRYRLVAPLGQGGMGRVWRATDVVLHREVAIKELVPPPGLTPEERQEMRERSLREARAIARLNNINVVRVFDVLRTDADPWIVMEYVPSRSLQDILAQDGPFAPVRAAEIGVGVLNALRAAHRAGVVHRDVKPGNVLIGEDGRVVLTDFGLATVPGDPNVTRTGLVLGSPAYIAPERARDGTAGPGADLWSLGATLYAAVEGASPFARPSAIATLAALATENPPPAKNAGPLKPVLNGLLRKDPAHRIDAEEAERLLLRAIGRRSKLSFPMSPTMRRPGIGRERPAPAAPPVVPGVSASAPVVPGPRPPVTPSGPQARPPVTPSGPQARPPVTPSGPQTSPPGRSPAKPQVTQGRAQAAPPVTPGRAQVTPPTSPAHPPADGGRPPVFAPGKAAVGRAPRPNPETPTRIDAPKPALDATRIDGPPVVDPKPRPAEAEQEPSRAPALDATMRGAGSAFGQITAAEVAAHRKKSKAQPTSSAPQQGQTPPSAAAPQAAASAPALPKTPTTPSPTAPETVKPEAAAATSSPGSTATSPATASDSQARSDSVTPGGGTAGAAIADPTEVGASTSAASGSGAEISGRKVPAARAGSGNSEPGASVVAAEPVESADETSARADVPQQVASSASSASAGTTSVDEPTEQAAPFEKVGEESGVTAPASADPASADPANADPATADPATADPATAGTATADSATADSATAGTAAAETAPGEAPAAESATAGTATADSMTAGPATVETATAGAVNAETATAETADPDTAAAQTASPEAATARTAVGETPVADTRPTGAAVKQTPKATPVKPSRKKGRGRATTAPPADQRATSESSTEQPAASGSSTEHAAASAAADLALPKASEATKADLPEAAAKPAPEPEPATSAYTAGSVAQAREPASPKAEPTTSKAGTPTTAQTAKPRRNKSALADKATQSKTGSDPDSGRTRVIPAKTAGTKRDQQAAAAGLAQPSRPPWQPMTVRPPSSGDRGVTVFGTTLTRRQTAIAIGVLVAVLLVLVLLIPLAFAGDDEGDNNGQKVGGAPVASGSKPPTAASSAAPVAPAPTTAAVPSSAPPSSAPASSPAAAAGFKMPAGWYLYKDQTGFSVPIPKGASIERRGTEVYFQKDNRLLIVDQTGDPKPDPVADWEQQERERRGTVYKNYNKIKLEPVKYFQKAADWEFTYTTSSGNPQHALKRGLLTNPNQAYGISWYTSPDDWNGSLKYLQAIYQGFKPKS